MDKINKPSGEEEYSVFDAGELDFISSNPLIKGIFEELYGEIEDTDDSDVGVEKMKKNSNESE